MRYTSETLDRATGELKTSDLGEWITVSELAELAGVVNRQGSEEVARRHYTGTATDAPGARLDLLAAIAGVGSLSEAERSADMVVRSASLPLVSSMQWRAKSWAKRGWTEFGKPVPDADLWAKLYGLPLGRRGRWEGVRPGDDRSDPEAFLLVAERAADLAAA